MGRRNWGNVAIILDFDFVFGKSDSDDFPICLSWRERQALLAIIDSLAWPTRWTSTGEVDKDAIEQLRNQLAYKLMGECPVDCTDVLACMDSPEGLEWLLELLRGNGEVSEIVAGGGDGSTQLDIASAILKTEGACDADHVFAFTRQMVQFLHLMIRDAFQVFEVLSNYLELIAALADDIPILTSVTDFITWSQENLYENYLANYDVGLENKFACDLFCLAMAEDCLLTWTDMRLYFSDEAREGFSGVDAIDFIQWLITGSYDGDEYVAASFALFCIILEFGGDWSGMTLAQVQRIVASFGNDTDSDHTILCDPCGMDWCHTFLGEANALPAGMISFEDYGLYNEVDNQLEGTFKVIEDIDTDFLDMYFTLTLPAETFLTDVEVTFKQQSDTVWEDDDQWWHVKILSPDDIVVDLKIGAGNHSGTYFRHYEEVSNDMDVFWIRTTVRVPKGTTNGINTITHLKFCGTGSDPFIE